VKIQVTNENRTVFVSVLIFNIVIGFYNLHMFVQYDSIFNLIVGSLNIGVGVFFRKHFHN
jgi:hypothetical protein